MARMYTVTFDNVAVAAAQDLFEITPAANKPCLLHALYLSNVGGTADAGDAQEELLRIRIGRGLTTSGTGGTAPTPVPFAVSDAAAGFTAEVNNTTVATTGTEAVLHCDGWNVRVPYQLIWTPETRPRISATDTRLHIRLVTAPADSVSCSGTLYVEEL